MRKLILTTAAVAAAIAGAFADETSFGTFTDTRDGQTYKTVKIGKQTWMAQNLNYQTESGSWCYKNSADSCNKYGRLYNWKTAKTACPKGWKLPSREDWDRSVATAGGKEVAGKTLKSKSGWNWNDDDNVSGNGTDNYRFSALPGGWRHYGGNFYDVGYGGHWWTATESNSDRAHKRYVYYNEDDVHENNDVNEDDYSKSYGFSVRCVADRP